MEDDKICEVDHFLKFISNIFWLSNSKQNLVQSENKNGLLFNIYYIYHKYKHYL
jgi:hypothetical protein